MTRKRALAIDFEFLLAAGIKTNRLIFLVPYRGTQEND